MLENSSGNVVYYVTLNYCCQTCITKRLFKELNFRKLITIYIYGKIKMDWIIGQCNFSKIN